MKLYCVLPFSTDYVHLWKLPQEQTTDGDYFRGESGTDFYGGCAVQKKEVLLDVRK